MACCLMTPSHYLNKCWLIIKGSLWHSNDGNFTGNPQNKYSSYEFENYQFDITGNLLEVNELKHYVNHITPNMLLHFLACVASRMVALAMPHLTVDTSGIKCVWCIIVFQRRLQESFWRNVLFLSTHNVKVPIFRTNKIIRKVTSRPSRIRDKNVQICQTTP